MGARPTVFALLAILTTTAASLAAAQENRVKNSGFEELSEDGKSLVAWGLPALAGCEFAWDDEVRHSGRRSARVVGLDPNRQTSYVQAWRQNVRPLPGGPLWLSVWVKAQDLTSGRVNVLHRDAEGKVLRNQGVGDFQGTFDWQEIAGVIEPEPGTIELQLVLGLQKSTGTVWLDDVSVTPVGDPSVEFGRLSMTPMDPGVAGATVEARFEVLVGKVGLREGGSVQLQWQHWRPAREFGLADLKAQVVLDAASAAARDARFETSVPPPKRTWPPTPRPVAVIATLVKGGPLAPGDRVAITGSLKYTPHTNVSAMLGALVVPSAGAAARPLDGGFEVRARGGPAARLLCLAEARPVAGQPGRVTVAATDEHGNPAQDFRGTVRLACNTPTDLPQEYSFTEADGGSHDFSARFPTGAVSRVTVEADGMNARSNPVLPRAGDEPGVYFGDIHAHCEISADAVGDPDQAYDYARRFLGMDFAGLADHSPRGDEWRRTIEVGNRNNEPGRFATILGFEWSHSARGHRNAYYRGDEGPEQPRLPDNMESWWATLDEMGIPVLTVPHHPNTDSGVKLADGRVAWGPTDWSKINHKYQRVVEICQGRGSFEVPGGPVPELRVSAADRGSSVQTALAAGHRLGFIGSTDTHSGRPGTGPARCAILSRELRREALWDAMYDRACYATTGQHLLVLFTLNGRPMGSEITAATATEKREVQWRAIGTGPIKRVDLLRNNEVVQACEGEGRDDLEGAFAREEPLTDTEWWYLRVIQENTEMAWSSPIWIDPPAE